MVISVLIFQISGGNDLSFITNTGNGFPTMG